MLPKERTASKMTVKFEEVLATERGESLGVGMIEVSSSATISRVFMASGVSAFVDVDGTLGQ